LRGGGPLDKGAVAHESDGMSETEGAGTGSGEPVGEDVGALVALGGRLGPTTVLAGVAVALPALGGFGLLYYINPAADWLRGHDGAGVVVYAVGFAVFAGLALLPTYAQAILGGWAFGFGVGFPAALAGFVGASLIGYAVARRASGDRVVKIIEERPRWSAVYLALAPAAVREGSRGFWRTLGVVALVRLPPNSPFALMNLMLASVRAPLVVYVAGTALGMAPRTAAAVWIAAGLRERFTSVREGLEAPTPWWVWVGGIAAMAAALVVIGRLARGALARAGE